MEKVTGIGEKGLELICRKESFRAKPYLCPSGVPTQGFGTTRNPDTGKLITLQDKAIDKSTALRWLKMDCDQVYSPIVDKLCRDDLTQNEFDALVSFTYNTGGYYLNHRGQRVPYQLYNLVNLRADEQTLRVYWKKTAITGNGKKLLGLEIRRAEEVDLFFE